MRRVVVTGIGGVTPLGESWEAIRAKLFSGVTAIQPYGPWSEFLGMRTCVAGSVGELELPESYNRKRLRSMSRAALLATRATDLALQNAALSPEALQDGRAGVSYGSCLGGPEALLELATACSNREMRSLPASTYVKVMSHACAASIGMFFGLTGRIIPSCTACTSGSQGIGFAFETIQSGAQEVMIAGGAEELCAGIAALFDSMCATSTRATNTPAPFDLHRDGLVLSEGACSFVLESLDHALARQAPIICEIVGFGTNSDGKHVTNPSPDTMAEALRLSLKSARLDREAIGFVHAHATGTELGDIAESHAVHSVLGSDTPVTALKGYFGHTLGATGAIEAWCAIQMMNERTVAPILNLRELDPRCAPLNYTVTSPKSLDVEYVMSNNFAFGGVNTSLIFRRWSEKR